MTRKESTECCRLQGLFWKPVIAKFDREQTGSDGGALLLKAADKLLGLSDRLSTSISDKREWWKIQHSLHGLLAQRVFAIACGYADANDAACLRKDPVHRLLISNGRPTDAELASQPTISRFENSINTKDLLRMGHSMADTVVGYHSRRLKGRARRITLDLDVTDDPTHGQQQLTFFHGYYLEYCYLPLLAFISFDDESEQYLVSALLRPGNVPDTRGAVALLSRLLDKLRDAFPRVEIRVRLDAGFASPEIYDFLESQTQVRYAIALPKNAVLKRYSEKYMKMARRDSNISGKTEKSYGECRYAAGTWKHKRRVVYKAEVVRNPSREPKDNQRFVVTNMTQSPEWIYANFYARRGDIENRIKELHDGMQIDRTSCSLFLANQFRVFLTVAAFILMQEIRRKAAGTDHARSQVWTIMLRLIKIGVSVVISTRRIVFHMPKSYPDCDSWQLIAKRLLAGYG